MTQRPTRIGIIGCGFAGSRHLSDLEETDVELGKIYDPSRETRLGFAEKAREAGFDVTGANVAQSYGEFVDYADHDGIIIASPHSYHAEQVCDALNRDVNVLVEKPLCIDYDEFEAIETAYRASEGELMVNYQKRYYDRCQKAKEWLRSGRIGEPVSVTAYRARETYEDTFGTWRNDDTIAGGGKLMDLANHTIDVCLWLLDEAPESCKAVTANREADVDMFSSVSAKLTNEAVLSISVSSKSTSSIERISIVGEKGDIQISKGGAELRSETETERVESKGGFDSSLASKFVSKIETDGFRTSLDSYFNSIDLALKAYESADERPREVIQ